MHCSLLFPSSTSPHFFCLSPLPSLLPWLLPSPFFLTSVWLPSRTVPVYEARRGLLVSQIHILLFSDPSRKKDFSFPVSIGIYISKWECDCPAWGHVGFWGAGYSVLLSWGGQPVPGRWWWDVFPAMGWLKTVQSLCVLWPPRLPPLCSCLPSALSVRMHSWGWVGHGQVGNVVYSVRVRICTQMPESVVINFYLAISCLFLPSTSKYAAGAGGPLARVCVGSAPQDPWASLVSRHS